MAEEKVVKKAPAKKAAVLTIKLTKSLIGRKDDQIATAYSLRAKSVRQLQQVTHHTATRLVLQQVM